MPGGNGILSLPMALNEPWSTSAKLSFQRRRRAISSESNARLRRCG